MENEITVRVRGLVCGEVKKLSKQLGISATSLVQQILNREFGLSTLLASGGNGSAGKIVAVPARDIPAPGGEKLPPVDAISQKLGVRL